MGETSSSNTGDADTGNSDTGDADTGGADTGNADTGDTYGELPDGGTGYQVGDVAYNLVATDQQGLSWSLYGQHGTPVVLLVGHLDVGASMTQPLAVMGDVARDAGARSVVMLGRNAYTTVSDTDDARQLAEAYGLDVVLTDPNMQPLDEWGGASAPRAYVIGPDLIIRWTEGGFGITEDGMRGAL